jgi:predicted ATPase
MAAALARHDQILRVAITGHRGHVFSTSGDGFAAAFWTPRDAIESAVDIQASLAAEPWSPSATITVRIGIHTGTADERVGDYFGPTLNRAARLMGAGHGGQILLSGITAQLADGFDLVDLGEQRLKDLADPERVFQVGRQRFPPLRTSGSLTIRLPEWGTRFWGRTAEMAALTDRVVSCRVVVLTGPGGLGKTRLAAQVAQQLVDEFGGIYFIGLAGIVAGATDYAIADGVGVQREPNRTALDSLVAWLGDRRVLLVLDNCEEVVETARAAVDALVDQCAHVHLLITSRGPVGARGEVRVPLHPLDRSAALDMFMDRLASTGRSPDVESMSGAARELCELLDGVPLALELAAARCRTLTPAELLVRLSRRPEVLADTVGLFDERHRDLDRLIGWSWHELSPLAQQILGRLTVVVGGFTLDAAEAIAGGDDVDELEVVHALEELEDSGLVVREETDVEVRHRLLEPIRQHVDGLTGEVENTLAARRHATWFSNLAREVKIGSAGAEFGRWADLVERDLPNFRLAHRLLIDAGELAGAVAIVDGLRLVGFERALMELADWCDTTVERVRGRNDHLELAALAAATPFWWLQNRIDEILLAAERMATVDGDAEHHVTLEEFSVRATLDPDRWPAAIAQLQRALARYTTDTPSWASGHAAAYLVQLGGLEESDVARIAARLDSPVFSATLAFYVAVPYYLRDEDEIGAELAAEALRLARTAGATLQVATALMATGGWRARVPGFSPTEIFGPLAESLDLWERLRIPWGRIGILEEIAQALVIRGQPEEGFVLWGAVDATGIQAPAKIGRRRRTDAYVASLPPEQTDAWRARGAAMSTDLAIAHARRLLGDACS